MDKKEKKKLAALQEETKMNTDSLAKEIELNENSTKILTKLWKNKLTEYKNTELQELLTLYQRVLTRQIEFKDNVIEKLLNETEEFKEYREKIGRKHLELVDSTLQNVYKKEIEEANERYNFEVLCELPDQLEEFEIAARINDNYLDWGILEYDINAIQVEGNERMSAIEDNYSTLLNMENGRFESVIDQFKQKDTIKYNTIQDTFTSILDDYNKKSKKLIENYTNLKEKEDDSVAKQNKYNTQIKKFISTRNRLEKKLRNLSLYNEANILIEKKNKCQNGLNKVVKNVINISEQGQKNLCLLTTITNEVYKEVDSLLEKGNGLMRRIHLCQRLKSSIDNTDSFSTFDGPENIQLPEQSSIPGDLSVFLRRISYAKKKSKLVDENTNRLQCENSKLMEEINCLINKNEKKKKLKNTKNHTC